MFFFKLTSSPEKPAQDAKLSSRRGKKPENRFFESFKNTFSNTLSLPPPLSPSLPPCWTQPTFQPSGVESVAYFSCLGRLGLVRRQALKNLTILLRIKEIL
jgi:hypothetical protein